MPRAAAILRSRSASYNGLLPPALTMLLPSLRLGGTSPSFIASLGRDAACAGAAAHSGRDQAHAQIAEARRPVRRAPCAQAHLAHLTRAFPNVIPAKAGIQ